MQKIVVMAVLLAASLGLGAQSLSLFESFTDHAVLQRDVDHPVWGWAKPGRTVSVTVGEQRHRAKADRDGKWQVLLEPMEAGGPYTLAVTAGREEVAIRDVYFGDVYLLSGQSNMEWRLTQSDPDGSRAAELANPMIRQLLVTKTTADNPEEHLPVAEPWKPGTAEEIADFSAVGSYFAGYLLESGVDVPIGLLHSSWGGSRIEPWMSAETLGMETNPGAEYMGALASVIDEAKATYTAAFGPGDPPTEDRGRELGYLDHRIDTDDWGTMELPGVWESKGYKQIDGIFYFRRTFDLTPEQARENATLYLGAIDDGDWTYINGTEVGITPNAYSEEREYTVPADVLKPGRNTIAIRVYDGMGGGGFTHGPEAMRLETAAGKVPLAGAWKYRIGEWKVDRNNNQIPTILYNAMIAPLEGMPLTGVLWYQGESNAGPGDAEAYADHMRDLVTSWREHFDAEELPFYWVQLANFQAPPSGPNEPGWATLRASQTAALDVPGTGQAVIIDIGEADDIHPRNKWEVGRRLSLHARKHIYGQDVQASSPVADKLDVDGNRATVDFDEVGEGLMIRSSEADPYGYLRGFTLQDDKGEWHWAQAFISGKDEVTVINPLGTGIRAVRYAWANNPEDANLYSKEGLPATPFELTDE